VQHPRQHVRPGDRIILARSIERAVEGHASVRDERDVSGDRRTPSGDDRAEGGGGSADRKRFIGRAGEDDVEILLKEIVYEYASDGQTMWQRKHLQMQIFRNGMMLFTDRYKWSGGGKCIVQSLTPDFNIANQRKEKGWDYFDVTFPHPLRRGQMLDFTIEWELVDENKIAQPFLSTMIDRDTKHLLLQVILPLELDPTRAYCYEFAHYTETLPIAMQVIHVSPATRILRYEIPEPKKDHKYEIRWYNH